MKPISPFGLGFMFFTKICFLKILNLIIFEQSKEPAAGGYLFSASNNVGSNFSQNYPPQTKNPGYVPEYIILKCHIIYHINGSYTTSVAMDSIVLCSKSACRV